MAISKKSNPANMPIAAVHQIVTAVFNPFTVAPSCQMTPAQMKPTPVTTCPAIRVGLESCVISNETNAYAAEPMHTSALV